MYQYSSDEKRDEKWKSQWAVLKAQPSTSDEASADRTSEPTATLARQFFRLIRHDHREQHLRIHCPRKAVEGEGVRSSWWTRANVKRDPVTR